MHPRIRGTNGTKFRNRRLGRKEQILTLSISVMKCVSTSCTSKADMVLYASLDASDQSESEFILPVPIQLKSKLLQSQCSLSKLQQ